MTYQAYQVPDPGSDSKEPRFLVISPEYIQILHSNRGVLQEVFAPEGIEVDLECYTCPNPECNCADDYYLDVSIKITKAEYDRLQQQPGWTVGEVDD